MILFEKLKTKRAINAALALGKEKEAANDLEGAYEEYCKAAELGNADAMVRIATLYYAKMFRPVEQNNMMELFLQGMPAFPWNTVSKHVPDRKSALEWFRRAADLNHPIAACMTGSMLCEGVGCKADKEAGLRYLKTAAESGITEARNALCIYGDHPYREFTREEYEAKLGQFVAAAGSDDAYPLYAQLKGGCEAYLSRLGYVLVSGKNAGNADLEPFQYSSTASGIPLIPVCPKRVAWKTFIRVDLNAFASEDTLIAISSDIDPKYMLGYVNKLVPAGTAVYRSPEFGWLPEEKHAYLYRIDRNAGLDAETLNKLAGDFCLIPQEYQPDNVAFLTEYGEKEYSVEIAAIHNGKVDILFRYTIGGSDTVHNYFQPELISMDSEVGNFPKESDYSGWFFPSWADS